MKSNEVGTTLKHPETINCNVKNLSKRMCCCPNTHLQKWRSLQPTWCVLGGTNLNPDPLSPQSRLILSRLTPREAKGGRPY
jgi:hypothetical protein